jgi:AmpD protein
MPHDDDGIPCLPLEDFAPVPYADPDCPTCGGDGKITNEDVYVPEQSYWENCPCIAGAGAINAGRHLLLDEDADGWLDGVVKVPARYAGADMKLEHIRTVVVHSLWKGMWAKGPQYFRSPGDGRYVSVHACIHKPGWERRLTQCVPITRVAWHAGDRHYNRHSIGIEHDGPFGEPDQYDEQWEVTLGVIRSLQELCPNLREIRSHQSITPRRRKDPGPHFPWKEFEGLGLEIVR